MKRLIACLLFLLPLTGLATSPLDGRWRLDKAHSSALDGWTDWDLTIAVDENRVVLSHDMQWHATKFSATNTIELDHGTSVPAFFRVEQRHMALYPAKGQATMVHASWLDQQRTLRVEADAPIENSQGLATMRIYSEYRVLEGGRELLLIELHSSRPRPLVYRFTKVTAEK